MTTSLDKKNGKVEVISLRDVSRLVIVERGEIKVAFDINGDITVHSNGNVKLRPAVNGDIHQRSHSRLAEGPKVGDVMQDGTVFAGVSPETNILMYITPVAMRWKQATEYAANLDAHGHRDWRVPTKNELEVVFQNRTAIGGFIVAGSDPVGWYWTSTLHGRDHAWDQRFSDGHQGVNYEFNESSVRCVR